MSYTVTQFARESVGLYPFHGSYVREFEFSVTSKQGYSLHGRCKKGRGGGGGREEGKRDFKSQTSSDAMNEPMKTFLIL